MTRGDAAPLAKLFDLFQRQIVARQMQQAVEQHRTVASRQDESVPIEPLRIGWIMLEKPGPQHIGHGRRAQRQTGMAAIGLLDGVHRQEANRVDRQLIQLRRIEE